MMNKQNEKQGFFETDDNDAVIMQNLVYKVCGSQELHMDIYHPQGISVKSNVPGVIFVHGESSKITAIKDHEQYQVFGKLIAASGMAAITFNHRMLLGNNSISDVKQDIDDAMKYVLTNAESLHIDPNRLCIWSISAGVPFGLYQGITNSELIKCIIAYYGFGDFKSLVEFFELDIADIDVEELYPISTAEDNKSKLPPIMIARAGLDNPIINQSLDNFIMKALSANTSIDIYNHATGRHAFDLLDKNERTFEIIKNTIKFIKNNI